MNTITDKFRSHFARSKLPVSLYRKFKSICCWYVQKHTSRPIAIYRHDICLEYCIIVSKAEIYLFKRNHNMNASPSSEHLIPSSHLSQSESPVNGLFFERIFLRSGSMLKTGSAIFCVIEIWLKSQIVRTPVACA